MNGLMITDSIEFDSINNTLAQIAKFQKAISELLVKGHDYGVIPGTKKFSLLKPGAEKICTALKICPDYTFMNQIEDYEKGFFAYTVKCVLMKGDAMVAQGMGHCNSKESKYIKSDGCTIANTILKMAKKRAQMDATLAMASLSDVFVLGNDELDDNFSRESIETMTVEEASGMILNIGKQKGKVLGEVYKTDAGWIKWFLENGKDEKVRAAINILSDAARRHSENKKAKQNDAAPEKNSPEEKPKTIETIDIETGEIQEYDLPDEDAQPPWDIEST